MTTSPVDVVVVGIIYDLDGVLADTATAHGLAWRTLCEAHDIPVNEAILDALRGRSRTDSLRALLGDRTLTHTQFAALLEEKNDRYLESIATLSPADALAGARENVHSARRNNAKTAVGSASKNARLVLDRLALTPLFDVIVDGNEVTHPKPHPEVFERAAQLLGLPVTRCAVIEDAASGIAAANQADMLAVGIGPHVDKLACALTARTLEDLVITDVIALLQSR